MTFVCTIPIDEDLIFSTFSNGGEFVATATVGYNDATDEVISLFVCLAPLPGGPGEFDLTFCVIESGFDGEMRMFDGLETEPLITEAGHRHLILQAICLAVRLLLREFMPPVVRMFTHTAHLPAEALLKFRLVLQVFHLEAYTIEEGEPHNGRYFWTMERVTP